MRFYVLVFFSFFASILCIGEDISYIFSGGKAERRQFPYQTSIQEKVYGFKFQHICSGAILRRKWVITTAYCVYNCKYALRIVAGLLVEDEAHPDNQIIYVKRIIKHPNYRGKISENDIALLKLRTLLLYSKAVLPISLPLSNIQDTQEMAMISGWNVHSRNLDETIKPLFYMLVYTLPKEECTHHLTQHNISFQKVLCSKEITKGQYCPGESGNTLTYNSYLIGLSSWGISPCGTTVYTKVSSFINFINHYIPRRRRST